MELRKIAVFIIALLVPVCVLAMTDNGDGTRTFYIGSGQDFETRADIVWGHPAGVMAGDTIAGLTIGFIESSGEYGGSKGILPNFIIFRKSISSTSP